MATILESYIGGHFRASAADRVHAHVNPSDARDVVGAVPEGTPADVANAVGAAEEALAGWRRLPGPGRAEHLYRWSRVIETRREELAVALSREVGKPIGEARGEVGRCEMILRYYAGEAVRAIGDVIPAQAEGALQFTLREPLGVVGLITPWNFPAAIPLWKTAPALAFGNTVVLKPAEVASHMGVLLAETADAAGLPPGVFNVVLGIGSVVGDALVRSPGIRAISFTGSSAAGARVAAICAERNVRFQTEMGGKNVVIVLPDADLDHAAKLTAAGAMRYAGQKCTATSRAVVAREVRDAFARKLRAEVDALPLGPVDDPASAVGPLISHDARASVLAALEGHGNGARHGGQAPSDPRLEHGFYMTPAIVDDVDPESPIAQDELFGPVLAVFTASDVEEAIALANRTRYGLSASLFTRDLRSVLEYVQRIETGLVRVNGDTTGVDPHAPFGGMKGSSSGTREQGPAAREFYTEIKTVQIQP
jgi:acyl-CoA reductase-like NAD-dependent aldehyde dehydrogenase